MSWPLVKLLDFCRPKQWKTIAASQLLDSGYPVYGANGKIGYYSKYTHASPTLMITCRGATCGNVHISEPMSYINGNAMALDDINHQLIDIKYLYHFFLKRGFNDVVSGSAQPQITGQGLSKLEIPIPPLLEQKRIATILDKADAIRRKRQQAIQLADEFLRAVFLDMFFGKDYPEMKLEELASKEKHSLSSGPFGSSLTSAHYVDKGILVLRGLNIKKEGIVLDDVKFVSEYKAEEIKRSSLKAGDVVVVAVGSSGKARLIPDGFPLAVMSQNFNKISPDTNLVIGKYLEFALNSQYVQSQLNKEVTDTVRTFLSLTKLKEVHIPLPPIEIQKKFSDIFSRKKLLVKKFCSFLDEELFESLSQKAFSGQL